MSAIKKFFEKKKLDRKFKKAGEGQTLNSVRQQPSVSHASRPQVSAAVARSPTEDQQRAADAAMARLNAKSGKLSQFCLQI